MGLPDSKKDAGDSNCSNNGRTRSTVHQSSSSESNMNNANTTNCRRPSFDPFVATTATNSDNADNGMPKHGQGDFSVNTVSPCRAPQSDPFHSIGSSNNKGESRQWINDNRALNANAATKTKSSEDWCVGNKRVTSNDEPKPNLIVNYLPQSFTDRDFFQLFAPFGAMESIKIMRDSQTGYSFGYGFVNYIQLQDAIDARNELNGLQLGHKRIKVSFARPPSDDIKDTNLFVTGLPTSITEQQLDKMFSPFGVIVHLRVLRDRHTKATRGVAFVRYETRSEACAAILEMNGFIPEGAHDPIRVRLAQDHGKQKAAYLAGYQAALKIKGSTNPRIPDIPFSHSESSFNLHPANLHSGGRGRPLTACVGEGIRVTSSTSDPSLYWKPFPQDTRRAETALAGSRGLVDRRANSRPANAGNPRF